MVSFVIYAGARFLFWLYFKLFFDLKVFGRKNLPKDGPFVFVSNHASYFDPILLAVSSPRFLNYLARDTLFKRKFFGWVMRNLKAIPIKRHGRDFAALRVSIGILKKNPLVIFPEGTRSVDGSLKEGKRGVGFLVAKARVPVVPAFIKGTREALPKWERKPRFHPIRVYIGRPMHFDSLNEKKPSVLGPQDVSMGAEDRYARISQEIMNQIGRLKEKYDRR